jgi:hypothetical protein
VSENFDSEVPSAELVRKVRSAFAGASDNSPFDKHLLIWSHNNTLQAAFISEVPNALSYCGGIYQLQQPYIGDWDVLINSGNALIGFAISVWGSEPIITSDFLRRHEQIFYKDGMLQIILRSGISFEIECIQGIGTRIFMNSKGNYMFLFPKWFEWDHFKFPNVTGEKPIPV